MSTIFYRVTNHCEASFYELETNWDIEEDGDYIVTDAAEDYHSNHDGWESSWPLNFSLHKTDGGLQVSEWEVEIEFEPSFSAIKNVHPNSTS